MALDNEDFIVGFLRSLILGASDVGLVLTLANILPPPSLITMEFVFANIGYVMVGYSIYLLGKRYGNRALRACGIMMLIPFANLIGPLVGSTGLRSLGQWVPSPGPVEPKASLNVVSAASSNEPKTEGQSGAEDTTVNSSEQEVSDAEEVRDLDELLSRGWITREEYEELKKELSQSS